MAERPEDLHLPVSVVTRIVKDALPDGVNVSKEARVALSKAASVFVLYATSCANNFAVKSKRKTVTGADIISAMEEMEFGTLVNPLTACLEQFRQGKTKKDAAAKAKKPEADKTDAGSSGDAEMADESEFAEEAEDAEDSDE
ncbi:DNA polymerase epsilon subunit 3 [Ixodes scapularis]|uniref:DNA polymerase epsilon subunit 3 n=1 Tax=Ixodes scapularis TaxID=6945 RepID=B7PJF1_IXOSC|nr:DNA polymerase epsilon subunit 3 [Ixodes scapularis]EEC06723.1 DNA polymerase epsilon P17 subunit, putative [Ixodes scapularis]|eukprot:XP_002407824.1 DNA polymerase epsilon P17 subunit, putative [Ixodes scapularis]